jgi:hypothetical protein
LVTVLGDQRDYFLDSPGSQVRKLLLRAVPYAIFEVGVDVFDDEGPDVLVQFLVFV